MEEKERINKIEAAREKLAAYKKRKSKKNSSKSTTPTNSPSHKSDTSNSSLDNSNKDDLVANLSRENSDEVSDSSNSISEHLESNVSSVENDRSMQEIEVSNFSLILHDLPEHNFQVHNISEENQPLSLNSLNSSDKTETIIADKNSSITNDVQCILNDILSNEKFRSKSENAKSDSLDDTNDISLNIFEGVSLDDSSINNYVTKLRQTTLSDVNVDDFNKILISHESNDVSACSVEKIKELEKQLVRKDSEIAALSAELDSLKEFTNSYSTTDYKPYQEEYHTRLVEFQNAVVHRDNLIQQLTESLQQSILNREELQQQSENFAKEISLLQKQLVETSNVIKKHKCDNFDAENDETIIRSPVKSCADANSNPKNFNTNPLALIMPNNEENKENSTVSVVDLEVRGADSDLSLKDLSLDVLKNKENVAGNRSGIDLNRECAVLEESLSVNQLMLLNELKVKINMYVQEKISESSQKFRDDIKNLKEKLRVEKGEYETEMNKLRQLLTNVKCGSAEIMDLKRELDAKHAKEMEELRTYFEKKCADLEKNYSEEIFSQHSRKMSNSSNTSNSDVDLLSSDLRHAPKSLCESAPGPGGDTSAFSNAVEQKILDNSKLNSDSLTVTDLQNVKNDLIKFCRDYEKLDFHRLSKSDSKKIRTDLANSHLRVLAKYDWNDIRSDMQNKYHAELEILREDYDNRMDLLNVEHDVKVRNMKESYQEQIDALKFELNEALTNAQLSVSTAVQEVASSGEYELAEVVQSYERRLQEQVTLAKIDIISALEHQIQILANSHVDAEWPAELLQIRNQFTEKYDRQIEDMKTGHAQEIVQLKEEHFKVLNGALERARRRSLKEGETMNEKDLEIIRDRDNLKKTNSILRHLLGELLIYFTKCEDELNKTLVDEIARHNLDRSATSVVENASNESIRSNSSKDLDNLQVNVSKRVHFIPNFNDFMSIIDNTFDTSGVDSKDVSMDLKNELGSCLERLKSDANAVLALTASAPKTVTDECGENNSEGGPGKNEESAEKLEEKITSLTRQILIDSQIKNDLVFELEEAKNYCRNLESERVSLENHVEQLLEKQKVLQQDLLEANKKIADLVECGLKEIISEGYGQENRNSSLAGRINNLAELQEKARNLVADWKNGADHPLIHLVEELCKEGERLTEEAKRDKEDLTQQVDHLIDIDSSCGVKIEAADKKLRATCRFLEEQAMEREMEREESQKEIISLKEQLKERDKEKDSCDMVRKEVEHLENQMREMTRLIEFGEKRQDEIENERKEAVDKIWVLRDIIRDLEFQVETKNEVEAELKKLIAELEEVIKQQTSNIEELNQELESFKGVGDVSQLKERILYLENETQKLRLNNELIGNEGAFKEIQLQLNQFETTIDKKTKDLEGLHSTISTTSCSSPSEDMSIKDQIRPQTPSGVMEECDIPLQQLARLKEKLVKHSRAEDAAVKRIRDVEMQLASVKQELEETQNEKEILQNQVTEQIVLLSSLQMRLDEQRLKAEHNQRQANSSLEVRIYDLENEVQTLKDTIHCRDKTIKQLNKVVEQTRERLQDREKELGQKAEDEVVLTLQKEIERLMQENRLLKDKIESDVQNAQILPNLVDNILADKNSDIEKLKQELVQVQKDLSEYQTLNFDVKDLKQLSEMVSNQRSLTDILSLMNLTKFSGSETEDLQARKMENREEEKLEVSSVDLRFVKPHLNEPDFIDEKTSGHYNFEEISSIDKTGFLKNNNISPRALGKPNSTPVGGGILKKVQFEDDSPENFDKLHLKIASLSEELARKDEVIKEFSEKLNILNDLEQDIDKLQKNLELNEQNLKKATQNFEDERRAAQENEKDLRIELAEKKMLLAERIKELELSQEDNKRKDEMYLVLAREKREIELKLNEARQDAEHHKNFDKILTEKNEEIYHLEEQLAKLIESCVAIEDMQRNLDSKDGDLARTKKKYEEIQEEFAVKNEEYRHLEERCRSMEETNEKLQKDLKNKSEQIDALRQELSEVKSEMSEKNKQIGELTGLVSNKEDNLRSQADEELKKLKALLVDRECELEILNEDVIRYQNEIAKLEEDKVKKDELNRTNGEYELQNMKLQKEIAQRDLDILKLRTDNDDFNKEVVHLQDHLNEKERVIEQMKADTKSLHVNLETIQNKIQETGNIVDLRRKLQEEQHLNVILREELNVLRNSAESVEKKMEKSISIEDIAGQVRKQLDYSAHLDSNILQALSSGEDDINDQNYEQNREQFSVELEKIKSDLQRDLYEMQLKLEREHQENNRLRDLLDKEKKTSNTVHIENANLIEKLRIRLEEVMENEKELERFLQQEKKTRDELENQVAALKQRLTNLSTSSNSKTEATEYKSLPNMDSQEVIRLREEVAALASKNQELGADFKAVKRAKNELESNLKYAKDMLQLKVEEIDKIEGKLSESRRNESLIKEEFIRNKMDLEQRLREIENSRELLGELEKEKQDMQRKMNSLYDKISEIQEERKFEKLSYDQRDATLASTVPDKFLNKMKELTNSLKEQSEESKLMTETLSKMTAERSRLLERIRTLEDQINYKVPFDDPVSRANHLFGKYLRSESYRKALVWQKRYLIALLATYQDFKPITERLPLSTFEPKYREPVRRSRGKQRFKCAAISVIAIVRMKYMVQRWHSGRRMNAYSSPAKPYHRQMSQNKAFPTFNLAADNATTQQPLSTQFQVGQPVSSQNFYTGSVRTTDRDAHHPGPTFTGTFPRSPVHHRNETVVNLGIGVTEGDSAGIGDGRGHHEGRSRTPRNNDENLRAPAAQWSGTTPPQRERVTNTMYHEHLAPLETPHVLSYFKRFNEIQQRLGMTFDNLNS